MPDPVQPFAHALEKLEFEKVRLRLQRFAVSGLGEAMVRSCGPITDRERLTKEHTQVTEMRGLLETEDTIPILDIRDIRSSLKRSTVVNTRLDPLEFVELLHTLRASRALRSYFFTHRDQAPGLHSLTEALVTDKLLERHIELTVDTSGRVLDTGSKRLRTIREDMIAKQDMLRKQCAKILRMVADREFTQEDVLTQRDGRMVIPLKAEHKRKIPGVVHSVSQTGQTVFVEPTETLELNNDIVALQFEEHKEIESILRELTDRVRAELPLLEESLSTLREIEFLYIRARYSLELNANPPILSETMRISIFNGKHPVLVAHHGSRNVRPLTVELGDDVNTLVISGPNAGGKTIALKTIGLLALMAQSGLHVPADAGTALPLFDEVFVDMGDDQSVENDLSTFSSHLRMVRDILERSTPSSLVLMDEIGTGTDPNEGGALAMSILAALTHRSILTVVTTHHGALKSFAHETPRVANAGMEFSVESLAPTYRMHMGRPGSSYAFEIARTLNLPNDVLQDAMERLGTNQVKLESLLHDLEQALQDAQQERHQHEEERRTAEALRKEYEQKLSASSKEARELIRSAKGEARALLDDARSLIEKTLRELREADKNTVREVRTRFDEAKRTVVESRKEPAVPAVQVAPLQLREGLKVALADTNAVGTLLTMPDQAGVVQVQLGAMKVKVKVDQLRAASPSETKSAVAQETHAASSLDMNRTLDLRGMYGDEAMTATDQFIGEASLAGLDSVEIIHGKGTGVLRNVVQDLLKQHPLVASFKLAEWNSGGSGVTIVELKR